MEVKNFPFICWWNGEVVVDGDSVTYKGGCDTFVVVDSAISFNGLQNAIFEALEVDSNEYKLGLKMKYPMGLNRGFKLMSLKNDTGLKGLWASVYQTKVSTIELYIELIPIGEQTRMTNISFTEMLSSQNKDPNYWSNFVDEADMDGNLEGDEIEEDDEEDSDDALLGSDDDNSDDDLVSGTEPNTQFTKLPHMDEGYVNSWYKSNEIPFKSGGEFILGQEFGNKEILARNVILYNVSKNQMFKASESKARTMVYKCGRRPNPCNWYLRASMKNPGTDIFTIVRYSGPHASSCVVDKPSEDHPNLKGRFIVSSIKPLVEADWGVKVKLLRASITKDFNFTISYNKAWRAKQKAIADLYGGWEKSYETLPSFMKALQEANKDTAVHFDNERILNANIELFHRVFWAFGPSIRGFKHCRPVITIDGTHLYGKYNGVLLIAMAVDANEQLFPLAFAIVSKENYNNWSWFMACIRLYVTQHQGICVISDRHPGIISTMGEVNSGWEEPHAYHRYCIRHVASNVKTTYKSQAVKNAFINTAFEHQLCKFNDAMLKLKGLNTTAHDTYLETVDLTKWSMAHDGGKRWGLKTTNMCEVFNGVLKGIRFLPIQAVVKATFTRVNTYFAERREIARSRIRDGLLWSEKITSILAKNDEIAAHHIVTCFNGQEGLYGVITRRGYRENCIGNRQHFLDLGNRTCTCNKWQNLHYPCSHVLAVCRKKSIDSNQFVDQKFSCQEYYQSYRTNFYPVADESYWKPWLGKRLMVHPSLKRKKGRPRNKRITNEMDEVPQSRVTCSMCHSEGHNKRSRSCPLRNSNRAGSSG